MTRNFPYSAFVGFDNIFKELETLTNTPNPGGNYPPFNTVKVSQNQYAIQLAVAGFESHELTAEIEDGVLSVRGEKEPVEDDEKLEYLHRGISNRNFTRQFRLHEYNKVVSANLVNGILTVGLEVRVPENKKPRQIAIGNEPMQAYTAS